MADKIYDGALPFERKSDTCSSISPSLGSGAKDAMVMASAIAFLQTAIYIIDIYRLPGTVAMGKRR